MDRCTWWSPLFVARVLVVAVLLSTGCAPAGSDTDTESAANDAARTLRERFPEHAAAVLNQEETFEVKAEGFGVALGTAKARGGPRAAGIELPRDGAGTIRLRSDNGVEVHVRELGMAGEGAMVEHAITYPRMGGASFWAVVPDGVEEWLHLQAGTTDPEEPAVVWEIEGAKLAQAGDVVLVEDEAGWVLWRVTAPAAFAASGREVAAWLRARDDRIELFVDAGGEAVLVDPGWTTTASMAEVRSYHTATRLPNGKVLVTGGQSVSSYHPTAELYDPVTNMWGPAASMSVPRARHSATLLPNGKVLVAGGSTSAHLDTAELYDPVAGTWSLAASMPTARSEHSAILLGNGKVLLAAGTDGGGALNSATLYDPSNNTWSSAGSLSVARTAQTAALLADGRVLIACGNNNGAHLDSAELYNPATNAWSTAASLATGRHDATATRLPDGTVLVAGGWNGGYVLPAERYDPVANTWTVVASLSNGRFRHGAMLLDNGKVLVAGGFAFASSELYDPVANTWTAAGSAAFDRADSTATLLGNGKVLHAGGNGLNTAELYDPGDYPAGWLAAAPLAEARAYHTATRLGNGKVLVAGGREGSTYLSSARLYDPVAGTWSDAASMSTTRAQHSATLLSNGKVLVAAGLQHTDVYLSSAEVYDPVADTWSPTVNTLPGPPRGGHTATLMGNGKVLVAGGFTPTYISSAALYDPSTNEWTATSSMSTPRGNIQAVLLGNGKVLVARSTAATAELYNPDTAMWTATSNSLSSYGSFDQATLLSNGNVLVAGGGNDGSITADLYDLETDTWVATGSMTSPRRSHTATLLSNGKVLVAGGYGSNSSTSVYSSTELYDPLTGNWTAGTNMGIARRNHTATLLGNGTVLVVAGVSGADTFVSSAELYTNQGAACAQASDCASGFCVDGRCCSTACAGLCQACSAAKTGGTNGTCSDVTAGTDPDDECAGATTCYGVGVCAVAEVNCNDGLDNNGALGVDAADPSCQLPAYFSGCGAGQQLLVVPNGTSIPIPDNTPAGVTSNVTVSGAGTISRVAVLYDIAHATLAQVDVALLTPVPSTIDLCSDNGGSGDNFVNTLLDPTCSTNVTAGTAPFTGCYVPENVAQVTALGGLSANGTWGLRVVDDASGGTGVLNNWKLVMCTTVCGDGQQGGTEQCDDGNVVNGDGCNSACLKELGQTCGAAGQCASGFCDPAGNICACDQNSDCPGVQLCNTTPNPNVCVNPGCGNGVLEAGEACDDGNLANGDGCDSACLKELGQTCGAAGQCASGFCDPSGNICACNEDADCPGVQLCNVVATPNTCTNPGCGNFVLEAGEACDDGNVVNGDGCDANCAVTGCGNGVVTAGEACDDGNVVDGDGCDTNCTVTACGNGVQSAGEACDDGNLANGDGCDDNCTVTACGNGVVTAGEACDDGNLANGDGCDSACLKELGQTCGAAGQCASGFCDPSGNICACNEDADCPGVQLCNVVATPNTCTNPGCGNFVLEAGEACDDGNVVNGDGCDANCTVTACGNGVQSAGEACDDGNLANGDGCDDNCTVTACGNGVQSAGEACDDGNVVNGDGCDDNCTVTACGNGVVTAGEACDDGNLANGDGCDSACLKELGQTCGAAGQCASGFCDPSGNICACNEDADCPGVQLCNVVATPNTCTNPGCGNFVLEAGEACDDGNAVNGDGCDANCAVTGCGNGVVTAGEACDDGNVVNGDGCDANCTVTACGNGVQSAGEACDDGNLANGDGCDDNCTVTACGNGVVTAGEACDDGNLANGDGCDSACLKELGQTCGAAGQCASGFCDPSGNICACNEDADCPGVQLCNVVATPNTCTTPGCGNFVLEAGETCDDGNAVDGDGCDNNCTGTACGNGVVTAGEACDDGNAVDGDGCDSNCTVTACGNGIQTEGEACDDGNAVDGDGCDTGCHLPNPDPPCQNPDDCPTEGPLDTGCAFTSRHAHLSVGGYLFLILIGAFSARRRRPAPLAARPHGSERGNTSRQIHRA